jgi:SNF2 family DNA or RNA helicase
MKIFTPRPWQVPAIDHLLTHPRCALWAPVGAGKTSDVLTALNILHLSGEDVWPALAIGPLRVARKVWREEVRKWTHLKDISVSQILGDADTRAMICSNIDRAGFKPHEVYTINYELVPWLVAHFGDRWPFRTIIPDESRKLKAFRVTQGGVMTQALASVAWLPVVTRFIELTGTPSPNGLRDLWGQLHFIDKGKRLGLTFSAFENRWFGFKRVQDALSHKPGVVAVIQKGSDEEIHELVKDVCLSIDMKDYVDIREPVQRPVVVELPQAAMKLYKQMERTLFIQIEQHEIEAFSAGAKTMKLLQLANGAAYLDENIEDEDSPGARAWRKVHDAKIEAVESIIEEMGDLPIIVAYNFKSDLARLLAAFPGRARHLHSEKDEDDFKAGLIPILLVHPKSAGHGIDGFQNVTNVLVFFSGNWDLELRLQTIGRIGPERQLQSGFDRPVYVYDVIAEDTIDEVVLARHKSKRAVQDLLLEAVKARGYQR